MPPEALSPAAIEAGAAELGVHLDDGQLGRLAAYAQLLTRWNAVHNLTAIRGSEELLTHHLLDSLAVVPHLMRLTRGAPARVLDAGSGGGLPGIVLAIAAPSIRLALVDAVQKKCAFLTQVKLELGLENVDVVHGRLETLRLLPFDAIVARALSTLAQLVRCSRHLLPPDGRWLAMKGKRPDDEIAALPTGMIEAILPLQVPGLDEQRHLIIMRNT